MHKIERALISVYNKTGVVELAKSLHRMKVEIISTGGTAGELKKAGIPVKEVASLTKFPEMLDGRVKTLHPVIHAGLLALRDNPAHMKTLEKHGISTIDLLVVNLYPFAETAQTKTLERDIIEMIDIGGPTMLRAAAKNFHNVGVVCDPSDYHKITEELDKNDGTLSGVTLRALAAKVFRVTSQYDGLVHNFLEGSLSGSSVLPASVALNFQKISDLRYGENPHQKGALYLEAHAGQGGVAAAKQHHGKELSFNNYLDLDAALEMVRSFREPACSVVKHTSPCGFAVAKDAATAFKNAHRCDPLSAFGGIIGFNTAVDGKTAKAILASGFIECIIAGSFTAEALKMLKTKKNLRLLTVRVTQDLEGYDYKKVSGGLLLQDKDIKDPSVRSLKCVTKLSPKLSEIKDLLFAFKVCRYVKSNAIVIAKDNRTVGLGMGQPSRVDSCFTALKKAGARSRGAVLASDGFFPKPDSISLAKKFGISAIIQPGGSIQDEEVIRACNKARIPMVFTGIRHFKH